MLCAVFRTILFLETNYILNRKNLLIVICSSMLKNWPCLPTLILQYDSEAYRMCASIAIVDSGTYHCGFANHTMVERVNSFFSNVSHHPKLK